MPFLTNMEIEEAGSNPLININEVSQFLGISINTVYSWVNQRRIPYVKIGRLLKFDRRDIEAWIIERKVPTKEFLN